MKIKEKKLPRIIESFIFELNEPTTTCVHVRSDENDLLVLL